MFQIASQFAIDTVSTQYFGICLQVSETLVFSQIRFISALTCFHVGIHLYGVDVKLEIHWQIMLLFANNVSFKIHLGTVLSQKCYQAYLLSCHRLVQMLTITLTLFDIFIVHHSKCLQSQRHYTDIFFCKNRLTCIDVYFHCVV